MINKMVVLLLIISFLCIPQTGIAQEEATAWRVTAQSNLVISGSSNINKFECSSLAYKGDDIIQEALGAGGNKLIMSGRITLSANAFDCQNSLMTKDLRKTIQAEKYPEIEVRFLSLERKITADNQQRAVGTVEISLAGVRRQYDVEASFEEWGRNKASLKGRWEFSFTDFNIDPPTKMMGAVRVDDCLSVYFNLELQRLTNYRGTGERAGKP